MSYITRISHVSMYYMVLPRVSAEISPGVNRSQLGSPIAGNGTAQSGIEPTAGLEGSLRKPHCNRITGPALSAATG
jgi:hypothetical protein